MAQLGVREEQAQVGDLSQTRNSLRGPLILAKLVGDALENVRKGELADYHAIAEQLSVREMKPVVMRRWLQALRLCVAQLDKEFDVLVGATLRFQWYDKGPEVADLYIDYLTHLLSAQTFFLQSSLYALVQTLYSQHPPSSPSGRGSPPPSPPSPSGQGTAEDKEQESVYLNVHEALWAVIHTVPTAPSVLMPILSKKYPFKGKNAELQEVALRNILHIISYCPSLRDGILHLVVHQMISIDVEVPREEEGGEEEGGEEEEEGGDGERDTQFHVELEGQDQSGVSENSGRLDDEAPPTCIASLMAAYCRQRLMSNEMAEKLDIMMTLLLHYCNSVCLQGGKVCIDSAVSLFQSLLKVFEQVVLPTHACSNVQFLLFKLTSYHEAFPGHFLDFLWEKFQDFNTPAVIRQAAAAYMGSYIARAKFIPLSFTKLCLTLMMQWIHHYIDNCSLEHLKPDVRQHGPFYSLCQAVFYTFVFKHRSLMEMEGGPSFLRQLNLDRVVSSRLNPLKVCLPTVVELFASLTSHHEIVFCYTILEENKRTILSTAPRHQLGLVASQSPAATNHLDSFFPFDPYCLKRSSGFIRPLYQEWEGPADEGEVGTNGIEDDEMVSLSSSCQGSSCGESLQVPSNVGSFSEQFSPNFHMSAR